MQVGARVAQAAADLDPVRPRAEREVEDQQVERAGGEGVERGAAVRGLHHVVAVGDERLGHDGAQLVVVLHQQKVAHLGRGGRGGTGLEHLHSRSTIGTRDAGRAPCHDEPQPQPNANPTCRPAGGNTRLRCGSAERPTLAACTTRDSPASPSSSRATTRRTTSTRPSARRRRRPATPRTTSRSSSWTTAAATAPVAWPPPAPPTIGHVRVLAHEREPRLRRGAAHRDRRRPVRLGPPHRRRPAVRPRASSREFVAPAADLDLARRLPPRAHGPAAAAPERLRVEPARRPRLRTSTSATSTARSS